MLLADLGRKHESILGQYISGYILTQYVVFAHWMLLHRSGLDVYNVLTLTCSAGMVCDVDLCPLITVQQPRPNTLVRLQPILHRSLQLLGKGSA